MPVRPGGKVPLCTLNARELKAAGADHDCGVKHAITDPSVASRVFRRMAKGCTERLNLGIVAHPSRIITVDADNPGPVGVL